VCELGVGGCEVRRGLRSTSVVSCVAEAAEVGKEEPVASGFIPASTAVLGVDGCQFRILKGSSPSLDTSGDARIPLGFSASSAISAVDGACRRFAARGR
jgi:hypothetical protein